MAGAQGAKEREGGGEVSLEPPGGLVIWIFILLEVLVFGIALAAFFSARSQEAALYASSRSKLNAVLGFWNTMLLVTSGYFVALGVRAYEREQWRVSGHFVLGGSFLGVLFLVLKGVEYSQKIAAGQTTGVNSFFDFYWLLTAFHAAHVVLGLLMLWWAAWKLYRKIPFDVEGLTLKASGVWWHMCDLVWVFLFPILYLI